MRLSTLLASLSIHPVLVDVGASKGPPDIWSSIASESTYIGFDPDLREAKEITDGVFRRAIMINSAVTEQNVEEVTFYLTKSPFCSSTLKPDQQSLSDYLFSDLFKVETETTTTAITLSTVLGNLGLSGIDWLKCDTQGTDLRIFMSLGVAQRSQVLAVDLEPGLIDAYHGEDLFIDVHREMLRAGFWASHLDVMSTVRMRKQTFDHMFERNDRMLKRVSYGAPKAPGWCEVRYLRTLESLTDDPNEKQYILLWIFAMMDNQPGFALDVATEYRRLFPNLEVAQQLIETSEKKLKSLLLSGLIKGKLKAFARRIGQFTGNW